MSRTIKWLIPAIAFALMLSLAGEQSRAQDEKKPGGTVSGTVKNEDGSAAANVDVRIVAPPMKGKKGDQPAAAAADEEKPGKGEKRRGKRPKPVAQGTTDADGNFSIADVPAGKFMVVAGGPGHGMAREAIEVAEGETVTVDLQLKPAPKRNQ